MTLHGSLAFTGAGHATDRAAILGLAGFLPDSYDATLAEATLAQVGSDLDTPEQVEGGTLCPTSNSLLPYSLFMITLCLLLDPRDQDYPTPWPTVPSGGNYRAPV